MRDKTEELIKDIIQPLIRADGGDIELVSVNVDTIVLHLSGLCAGCPGIPYTTQKVIEPVLKKGLGESITIRYEY